jgi:hypothetical protein
MTPKNLISLLLALAALSSPVSAEWKEKVLYSFQGGSDGFQPAGGVVFDKSGNLYGATSWGGTICPSPGCGVVFEVSPPSTKGGAWTETAIYVFKGVQGGLGDGLTPVGGVINRSAGEFVRNHQFGRQRSLHFAGVACRLRDSIQIVPACQEGTAMEGDDPPQLPRWNRRLLSVGRFDV